MGALRKQKRPIV